MPNPPRRHWYQERPSENVDDMELAQCSLAGRGAFMVLRDYIRIKCDPGRLAVDGSAVSLSKVAFMFHVEHGQLEVAVTELVEKNVARRDGDVLELPREIKSALEYERLSAKGSKLADKRWHRPNDEARMGPDAQQTDAARMGPDAQQTDAARNAARNAGTDLSHGGVHAEQTPSHSTRARASGSRSGSGSGSGSGEGGTGEDPEPHIPTVDEFIAAFMADGMPEEWLRRQWEWFQGNGRWLTRQGQLVDYRVIIRGRWRQDRPAWKPSSVPRQAVDVASMEQELAATSDPEKRVRLLKTLHEVKSGLEKPKKE